MAEIFGKLLPSKHGKIAVMNVWFTVKEAGVRWWVLVPPCVGESTKYRDGKLWLGGQITLTACFCRAHMLRRLFACLHGWKKIKRYFMMCEKYEIDISVSVNKVLLERGTLVHLHVLQQHSAI